jgi:putative membrane protein
MSSRILVLAGLALLAFAWAGPLPRLVPESFAAHMSLHMLVVGIGIPVLAVGLAQRLHTVRVPMSLVITASVVDLVVVWLWHVPVLHHASRTDVLMLGVEQASFAGAALLVWLVAFGGPPLAGALTLFLTSMHMTLLGALLGLAPRPFYLGHHDGGAFGLDTMQDQQLGGVIMLAIGGVIYLSGGLVLVGKTLRRVRRP